MEKTAPRHGKRDSAEAIRRRHRANILAALLAICRELEQAQSAQPARQACAEVAVRLQRMMVRETAAARS